MPKIKQKHYGAVKHRLNDVDLRHFSPKSSAIINKMPIKTEPPDAEEAISEIEITEPALMSEVQPIFVNTNDNTLTNQAICVAEDGIVKSEATELEVNNDVNKMFTKNMCDTISRQPTIQLQEIEETNNSTLPETLEYQKKLEDRINLLENSKEITRYDFINYCKSNFNSTFYEIVMSQYELSDEFVQEENFSDEFKRFVLELYIINSAIYDKLNKILRLPPETALKEMINKKQPTIHEITAGVVIKNEPINNENMEISTKTICETTEKSAEYSKMLKYQQFLEAKLKFLEESRQLTRIEFLNYCQSHFSSNFYEIIRAQSDLSYSRSSIQRYSHQFKQLALELLFTSPLAYEKLCSVLRFPNRITLMRTHSNKKRIRKK